MERGAEAQGEDCGYDAEDVGLMNGACGGERDVSVAEVV